MAHFRKSPEKQKIWGFDNITNITHNSIPHEHFVDSTTVHTDQLSVDMWLLDNPGINVTVKLELTSDNKNSADLIIEKAKSFVKEFNSWRKRKIKTKIKTDE